MHSVSVSLETSFDSTVQYSCTHVFASRTSSPHRYPHQGHHGTSGVSGASVRASFAHLLCLLWASTDSSCSCLLPSLLIVLTCTQGYSLKTYAKLCQLTCCALLNIQWCNASWSSCRLLCQPRLRAAPSHQRGDAACIRLLLHVQQVAEIMIIALYRYYRPAMTMHHNVWVV